MVKLKIFDKLKIYPLNLLNNYLFRQIEITSDISIEEEKPRKFRFTL